MAKTERPNNYKYETLVKVLDKICADAPAKYSIYKPQRSDSSALNAARSRAYIHLYLRAVFGVTDFEKSEKFVTDGPYDGGVDAYYIDHESKKIYLIQSKFVTNAERFEEKEINANDLSKMDISRILDGKKEDEHGNRYRGKILQLQKEISELENFNKYSVEVVLLANLKRLTNTTVKRLIEGYAHTVFDFSDTYRRLVLTVSAGTYYEPEEIVIKIDLKEKRQPRVDQEIVTSLGKCRVIVLFVPTTEIAVVLHKYRNAILGFNPRNYLSLNKNEINRKIANSIEKISANDFAIFNNGITLLSKRAEFEGSYGIEDTARLVLSNPQIINGAQTAYTLSRIYESQGVAPFKGKEVMLRVIEIEHSDVRAASFIESLSDATNQQNKINEADRRSNDPIQIKIQKDIYEEFGYFYSRKRGEFENGVHEGFVDKKLIIDREQLVKSYIAYLGDAAEARGTGEALFRVNRFRKYFGGKINIHEVFFAYKCFVLLSKIGRYKKTPTRIKEILRYGRMAVIAAIGARSLKVGIDLENSVEKEVKTILGRWPAFEKFVRNRKANSIYIEQRAMDWDNYYKGGTLNTDIKKFFK